MGIPFRRGCGALMAQAALQSKLDLQMLPAVAFCTASFACSKLALVSCRYSLTASRVLPARASSATSGGSPVLNGAYR